MVRYDRTTIVPTSVLSEIFLATPAHLVLRT